MITNLKGKVCWNCQKLFFPNTSWQVYCGNQRKKEGCAYIRCLAKIKEWNKRHHERLKGHWIKASKKYREEHFTSFRYAYDIGYNDALFNRQHKYKVGR